MLLPQTAQRWIILSQLPPVSSLVSSHLSRPWLPDSPPLMFAAPSCRQGDNHQVLQEDAVEKRMKAAKSMLIINKGGPRRRDLILSNISRNNLFTPYPTSHSQWGCSQRMRRGAQTLQKFAGTISLKSPSVEHLCCQDLSKASQVLWHKSSL